MCLNIKSVLINFYVTDTGYAKEVTLHALYQGLKRFEYHSVTYHEEIKKCEEE
ncbi:MAG: hypothetical protein INQ03_21200 [Candidatus Heimdallarchaeota archaeon]|nr:hypothetical protein [Candidatus Heimdallarchaeota archaeon]